jgi:hypothetical protein
MYNPHLIRMLSPQQDNRIEHWHERVGQKGRISAYPSNEVVFFFPDSNELHAVHSTDLQFILLICSSFHEL